MSYEKYLETTKETTKMKTVTIPQFPGNFAIELDGDLYCAMQGPQSMYKNNGKVAEFKSLSGAVKFFASRGILPVETEAVEEVAEPVIEIKEIEEVASPTIEVEEIKAEPVIAQVVKIAAKYSENVCYKAKVFTLDGYQFIGKDENLTESEVRTLLAQNFPGAVIATDETGFARLVDATVDAAIVAQEAKEQIAATKTRYIAKDFWSCLD